MPARAGGDGVHRARIERAVGDERAAPLLGHADVPLLPGLGIHVAEMDVEKLHSADLLELLLHPAAGFQGVFQTATDGLLVVLLIGIEELEEPRDCAADGNRVSLIQVSSELEILGDGIAKAPFPHLPNPLGQVVGDEPEIAGQELAAVLGQFPSWDVGREAIHHRQVQLLEPLSIDCHLLPNLFYHLNVLIILKLFYLYLFQLSVHHFHFVLD